MSEMERMRLLGLGLTEEEIDGTHQREQDAINAIRDEEYKQKLLLEDTDVDESMGNTIVEFFGFIGMILGVSLKR